MTRAVSIVTEEMEIGEAKMSAEDFTDEVREFIENSDEQFTIEELDHILELLEKLYHEDLSFAGELVRYVKDEAEINLHRDQWVVFEQAVTEFW